jgi:hypothetical protein
LEFQGWLMESDVNKGTGEDLEREEFVPYRSDKTDMREFDLVEVYALPSRLAPFINAKSFLQEQWERMGRLAADKRCEMGIMRRGTALMAGFNKDDEQRCAEFTRQFYHGMYEYKRDLGGRTEGYRQAWAEAVKSGLDYEDIANEVYTNDQGVVHVQFDTVQDLEMFSKRVAQGHYDAEARAIYKKMSAGGRKGDEGSSDDDTFDPQVR